MHRMAWQRRGVHKFPTRRKPLIALLKRSAAPANRGYARTSLAIGYRPRHVSLAPAGMEMWGYSPDVRFVKDTALTFDFAALGERLATRLIAMISMPSCAFGMIASDAGAAVVQAVNVAIRRCSSMATG